MRARTAVAAALITGGLVGFPTVASANPNDNTDNYDWTAVTPDLHDDTDDYNWTEIPFPQSPNDDTD